MGYASYTLPDGREAGYGVDAECDATGCAAQINRGMDYLCGDTPDGLRPEGQPGCGKYHCPKHQDAHDCASPACDEYPASDEATIEPCHKLRSHTGAHADSDGVEFVRTESDELAE